MIPLGSHPVWHPVFETLAYASGYGLFRYVRERKGDIIEERQRWVVIAAAAVGALLGSRILGLAEQWPTIISAFRSGRLLVLVTSAGGKTIVGGLLGGWISVEIAKKWRGIRTRTGDLFVLPLCLGIALGRFGCLLAGLADDTYGKGTNLPWGIDFGDGIPRHPVQLYEVAFLALLALSISRFAHWPKGARFRVFLGAYLGWRVLVDFLKPQPLIAGLNLIQWACVAGLAAITTAFVADLRLKRHEIQEQTLA